MSSRQAIIASRPRRRWLIGVLLAVMVIAVAAAAAWWKSGAGNTVQYTTMAASQGPITRAVTATGTVNPELTIIVGTYVSGVIQALYCDYNTEVKKGQLCAKIDPRPYQSMVDQNNANLLVAKAQMEKDKANLNYTRLAFERAGKLLPTKAVSQDAYEVAKSNYEQAQAQLAFDEATIKQRQAALDSARVNLDYTNIVSPVDGVVVSRSVTIGQTVAASFQTPTLFLIATDLTKMQVDTNVSESDIGGIRVGDKATFTVDAFPNRILEGEVRQVRQSPQTVQNVVTYDVVVAVDNGDLALKPGMTAATRIVIDHRDDVVRVPNAALRYRPAGLKGGSERDETRVWTVRQGKAAAVPVSVGLSDDSYSEIVSGEVKPGDQLITAERASTAAPPPRLRF